ncbi:MAG: acyl-CoA dehydrogenase family protein, partial [Gammaproteobacteria bacterium]
EEDGRIADEALRAEIVRHAVDNRAFRLTQRRTVEEAQGAQTPGPATSIFKLYGANLGKKASELRIASMGVRGIGLEGDPYTTEEIDTTQAWLRGKASSIAGGSNEVQMNIIAKRVLGLPD